jgi:MFS family permease
LLSIAFFGQFSWGSNLHTVITEITPPRHVAALFGITGAVGTLMAVISQPLIGRLVDSVGYGPAFAAAGLIFTVAIVLLLAAGKIKCFESTCCS